jgi:threonine dehydratase
MAKIAKKLTDLIGNTPLLELGAYGKTEGVGARLIAKLESFNPLSSVKDRIGYAMISDAEERAPSSRTRSSSSRPAATPASPWPSWLRPRATA